MFPIRFLAPSLLILAMPFVWAASASPATASAASSAASATPGQVVSGSSAAHADERARIARERAAAEARYGERERECRQRFIVTSCLDDAKAERRQTIDRLRARQLLIDEARRQERTAERHSELADKAAEDARRESVHAARSAASAASGASSAPAEPAALAQSRRPEAAASGASGARARAAPAARAGTGPHAPESRALREQREAASRAAFDARKAQASEHRDEVVSRTTKRMARKSPAAGLRVPGAASSPAKAASRP